MLGAIVGDIVGSTREWHNVKSKDFTLLPQGSRPTDDSVMTLAVALWLIVDRAHSEEGLVHCMQKLGREYLDAGYGRSFLRWLCSDWPQPYNSWGNGSAMRVSPVAMYAGSLDEALMLAATTATVTHNHPEGIKGAMAIASSTFLARKHVSKKEIRNYVVSQFGYDLDRSIDCIRPGYKFDVSCQGSCPEAIIAYLESDGFEDAIRNAISLGGDSDTIAAMTGAIAGADYGVPYFLAKKCEKLLPLPLKNILNAFENAIRQNGR